MPYTPHIGDRVRVVSGYRARENMHYFPHGTIVEVYNVRSNLSFDARRSMAGESAMSQVLFPSHVELVEPTEEVSVMPTVREVQRGDRFRIVSGFQTEPPHMHYFRHGTIVEATQYATGTATCQFQACRVDGGNATNGLRTQWVQMSQVQRVANDEGDDEMPIEDDRPPCANCGDTNGDDSFCPGCGRGPCCRSFRCENCSNCTNCCECDSGVIRDAGCRDYPACKPRIEPYKGFLYLGVELEVECGDEVREEVASEISKRHNETLLLKEDGSLENGFEMVTGPFSLDVHKGIWENIVNTATRAGARSWRKRSTGLHVHMSRGFFTPLSIGKLLVFLNSDATRKEIVKLAGRESPDFAAMQKKKLTDAVRRREGRYNRDGVYEAGRIVDTRGSSGSRYEALNLTNDATIEVRIFKGTLNTDHILADLEFCHAAAYWTKNVAIADCENWSEFWAYAMRERKLYPHFIKFMTARNKTTEL